MISACRLVFFSTFLEVVFCISLHKANLLLQLLVIITTSACSRSSDIVTAAGLEFIAPSYGVASMVWYGIVWCDSVAMGHTPG